MTTVTLAVVHGQTSCGLHDDGTKQGITSGLLADVTVIMVTLAAQH